MKKSGTRVLLLRPVSETIGTAGHVRDIRVPFVLKYVQAMLTPKGGFETCFLDGLAEGRFSHALLDEAMSFEPEVAVISSTTLERGLALSYAQQLKKRLGSTIILLGQDASLCPQEYLYEGSPVDFVIRGEAERSCVRTIEALKNDSGPRNISGLCVKGVPFADPVLEADLDGLPFPAYDLAALRRYRFYYPLPLAHQVVWGQVVSSRGCPYGCVFCSQMVRESFGQHLRLRSPENIVDEIEYLQKLGANFISFNDDNLTTQRGHVENICAELRARDLRIRWTAHARIDNCDEKLLRVMKEAGCVLLRFGVESGSQRVIEALGKTTGSGWATKALAVFTLARKVGIATVALFIIGSPDETPEEVAESMALLKDLRPDLLQVHYFTLYPGSPAFRKHEERLAVLKVENMYHYQRPVFNVSRIADTELEALYQKFYRKYLATPGYVFRHAVQFGMFYLNNPDILVSLFRLRKEILDKK